MRFDNSLTIIITLFFINYLPIKSDINLKENKEKLLICIVAHKDFVPPVKNHTIYKIIVDKKQNLNNPYLLEILETNKNNEFNLKSRSYCEFNKIFWTFKNYRPLPKYIGFIHYRRYFTFYDNPPDLDNIFSSHDSILPHKIIGGGYTNVAHYDVYHGFMEDFNLFIQIIKENYNEYYDAAIKYLNLFEMFWCTQFIVKKEDFLKIGDFLYGISKVFDSIKKFNTDEDVENYVNINYSKKRRRGGRRIFQQRLQSFILERLINIYYVKNFKSPFYLDTDIFCKLIAEDVSSEKKEKELKQIKEDFNNDFFDFYKKTNIKLKFIVNYENKLLIKEIEDKEREIKKKELEIEKIKNSNRDIYSQMDIIKRPISYKYALFLLFLIVMTLTVIIYIYLQYKYIQ